MYYPIGGERLDEGICEAVDTNYYYGRWIGYRKIILWVAPDLLAIICGKCFWMFEGVYKHKKGIPNQKFSKHVWYSPKLPV